MLSPNKFKTPTIPQRNERRSSVSFPLADRQAVRKVLFTKPFQSDSKLPHRSAHLFSNNNTNSGNHVTTNSSFKIPYALTLGLLMVCSVLVIGAVSNVRTTTQLYNYLPTFDAQRIVPNRVLFKSFHEPLQKTDTGKPKLVIHMGPHKTASTTMQTDLTQYQDRLARDSYVYLGRMYHPFNNGYRVVLNRTPDSNVQTAFRNMFQRCWKATTRECVEDLRDLLRFNFRKPLQAIPNLLISDEAFLKLFDNERYGTRGETYNRNYVLLKEVLGPDWDIVVVLAYRRFYEWLPSSKHQKDKPTTERAKTEWPSNHTAGVAIRPLFPADASRTEPVLEAWKREHFFTETTVRTLKLLTDSHFKVKLYHLYGKVSVRTNFFCHVLPHAEFSCRASQKQDVVFPETRINARESTDNEIVRYPPAFFDLLATSAVQWIDTSQWQRQVVAKALQEHYYSSSEAWQGQMEEFEREGEDHAQVESIVGAASRRDRIAPPLKNPWSLPLMCPNHEQLELLLKESISIEAKYLPKLYGKTARQHRLDFWQATTSPDYCIVDTQTLFASDDSPWKEYIVNNFGPKT